MLRHCTVFGPLCDNQEKMRTPRILTSSASKAALLWKWSLSALFAAVILMLAASRDFYDSSMTSAYLALAIASALVILLVLRRSWTDLLLAMAGGGLLALLDLRILLFPYRFMTWFSFMGMSSFFVLGLRAVWAEAEDRKMLLCAFVPAALFVGSEYMASTLLDITEMLHPKVFDLFLYSFDCSLRLQIAFKLGKLLVMWPWLRAACLLFYLALPLPLALVFAAHLRQGISRAMPVMLAFLLTGPVGVLFYNMLPACGPIHLFGAAFPLHPPAIADVMRLKLETVLIPHDARNAIPSLHMAWVLLVWWSSRGLARWIRAMAFTFLAFTAVATMGIGEHYFVDVVVAYPFALMVLALCSFGSSSSNEKRRAAFFWGTFCTLLWFALLSFATQIFWVNRVVPWTMVIVTIAATVIFQARLQRALGSETGDQPAEAVVLANQLAQHA
jgi:PAP2 superfamily